MAAQNILIVGAGIGGLTAALAFSRAGHDVDIAEQAHNLSEVGAGLQLSPNASRILIQLGLGDALRHTMTCPQEITLASGRSLRKIARVPCGDFAAQRWGAPYGVLHRADLQTLLIEAVRRDPRCRLRLGERIDAAAASSLHTEPEQRRPALIVGADGVWSETRSRVPGAQSPRFSRQVAWRLTIPAEAANGVLDPENVTAFLGPFTHLVAYPLRQGAEINIVAITPGRDPGPTWAARENLSDRNGLLHAFADWHPDLVSILREAPHMTWWPLFEVPDGRWSNDVDTVLIGDAAHAMTPFAAQGAAMAIEDGYELAQSFTSAASTAAAMSHYESHRRSRVARARNRAAFNQFVYHARGPIRIGRDIVLALKRPESLARDLDWLYGYRSAGL